MYNKLYTHIRNYRLALQKIILGLCFFVLCACEEVVIYKNIVEVEANLMTATLMQENISVQRTANKDGTYNIVITDATEFAKAVNILSMRGLPRAKFDSLCTIFKGDGMVSTPVEQKARYTCAKSQELSGSLTELDGISAARVHLVLSETDPISRKVKPASASVMIRYKAGVDVDALVPRIKQLISYGVEELPYQNVSVMLSEEMGHKQEMVMQNAQHKANMQNMLGQTENATDSSLSDKNINLFAQDSGTNGNTMNTTGTNMLVLYILMGMVVIGMAVILYFMMQMKNKMPSDDKQIKPFDDSHHNLPIEF